MGTCDSPAPAWDRRTEAVAELVVWLCHLRPPTLGAARLICIDGGAGAGKSTLGRAVLDHATELGTARLLHVDDLLDGWSGLARVGATLADDVLGPLRSGRPGRYRRHDWARDAPAELHTVDPVDTLVVEGVGSWSTCYADAVTTLVWVDAPVGLRLRRGLERDGEGLRARWLAWLEDEAAHFARERTRDHADVVVDGTGESDRAVVLG